MTKKHFKLAVEIVKEIHKNDPTVRPKYDRMLVAKAFIELFKKSSDKFNEYKFLEACELIEN